MVKISIQSFLVLERTLTNKLLKSWDPIFNRFIKQVSIAVDNDVKIRDKENGNVICAKRAKAAGDGLKISFGNGIHVQGIYVSELDGGILLIYI